jgi:hypothetical protein
MQGGRRRELARLWQVAVRRPRWQLWTAALVSLWTLCWIFGQLAEHASSPLGVLRVALGWADVPTGWLEVATVWWQWLEVCCGRPRPNVISCRRCSAGWR